MGRNRICSPDRAATKPGVPGGTGVRVLGGLDEEDIRETESTSSHAGGFHEAAGIEPGTVAALDDETPSRFEDAWNIPKRRRSPDHPELESDHSPRISETVQRTGDLVASGLAPIEHRATARGRIGTDAECDGERYLGDGREIWTTKAQETSRHRL